MDSCDINEPMGLLKSYPDARRPLVKIYGVTVDGRPAFKVQWKSKESGKWVSKRKRSRKDAETIARQVVKELQSNAGHSDLLTDSDRKKLELARSIPIDRLRQLASEYIRISQRLTFSEWIPIYSDIMAIRSIETQKEVRYRTNKILKEFGPVFLDSLSLESVETWYRKMLKQGAVRSANNDLRMLKRVLNKAKDRGYLPDSKTPADSVVMMDESRASVEILDLALARKFLDHLPENDRVAPFVLIGMFAGLRPSEMEGIIGGRRGLDWKDVNFEGGFIHVTKDVAAKNTHERFVELQPILTELLLPFRKSSGQICLKKAREQVSAHYRDKGIVETWTQDILRHSYCSYLLAKSQDIGFVADQAGNSPGIIKKNYRRPVPKSDGEEFFNLHKRQTGAEIIQIAG